MKLPNKIIYRPHISEQRRLYFIFASLVVVLPFLFAIISLSAQFSFGQKIPSSIWNIGLQALSAAIGGTLISLFGGYWLAHSLFRVDFRGKNFLLNIFSLTMVLPPIIAIVGLVDIFGQKGIINQLLIIMGLSPVKMIYNMVGVLIIFTFYNIPFCALVFLERLSNIPKSYWKSAEVLGFSYSQKIKIIELPLLKNSFFYTGFFVFLLCFTSFAPVLIMGGGKIQTFTTALYNGLKSFNLNMVVQVAIAQFVWSFIALCCLFFIRQKRSRIEHGYLRLPLILAHRSFWHRLIIILCGLYIIMPIMMVLLKGLHAQFWLWLFKPEFINALGNSLYLSVFSAILAVILSIGLSVLPRYRTLLIIANLPMMIPSFILIAGIFVALSGKVNLFQYRSLFIIITSALMSIPLITRLITEPIWHIYQNQYQLAYSLNIRNLNWYRQILLPQIRLPLIRAFAMSMAMCFGDFGVIAFLGSKDLITLPLLLYEQMGRYRFNDADALACILLLVYIGIFSFFMREKGDRHVTY